MREYDRLLDENDWDIYYWATQPDEAPPSSSSPATSTSAGAATNGEAGGPLKPAKGEWAQTLGTYKAAYRPVPQRWKGSELLEAVRRHVEGRKAGGRSGGGGMAFMPGLRG
jgi:hypothetical protein